MQCGTIDSGATCGSGPPCGGSKHSGDWRWGDRSQIDGAGLASEGVARCLRRGFVDLLFTRLNCTFGPLRIMIVQYWSPNFQLRDFDL